jgi:hypothetical protein
VCATVNEPGVQYTWMAQRKRGNAFTPLSRAASEAFERIGQVLTARLTDEREGKSFAVPGRMFLDCVHKLEAVAYHLTRLRAHKARLLEQIHRAAEGGSWGTAAFLERETVFEFEALVLQARATLDTVTWFLSHACGQKASTFKKLRKVLCARTAKDKRIRRCLALLDQCPWMSTSSVLVVGDPSTRDYLTHYGSLLTTQQTCFTASRTEPDRALLFDMEMRGDVPVMTTASQIHQEVPFFVMGVLTVFLDLPLTSKEAFTTDLAHEFVVLSEAAAPAGEGTKVGVVKEMRPGGFTVGDVSVSTDILDKAVTLSKLGAGPVDD